MNATSCTAEQLTKMFAAASYSSTRVVSLRYIDDKAGWALFEVKLAGKYARRSTRAFADFTTGKAWPVAELNCRGLERAGR